MTFPQRSEKAEPALDARLGFIGADHLGIAHVAGWNIGTHDKAGALLLGGLNDLRCRSDLGVHLPRNRLRGARRGGAPFACITFVLKHAAGVELMRAPHFRQRRQCGLRHLRCLKTLGMQVEQLLLDGVPFTLLRLGDARLGTLHGGLRT